jgi:predicted short-subunit dehydrogenase-like oxidoreductase (DUF2520 family)
MERQNSYKFAIIGLGMVGTAIGHLLKKSGHKIIAVCDKSSSAMKRANRYTGGENFSDPRKAIVNANAILITTPDDCIANACREIADPKLLKGKLVFHMSGAGGLDLLDSAKEAGAIIASIHPLQSFSSIDNAIKNIPGSIFGITAGPRAKKKTQAIVRGLKGIPILISPAQKPLYHAAACFASNYLVTLLNTVESIYCSIGISRTKAQKAYWPLIYGTLKNIEAAGSVCALTGPIARGDTGTIQNHITAIKETQPQYSALYSSLGIVTTKIAREKGSLSPIRAKKIINLLKGVVDHEHSK